MKRGDWIKGVVAPRPILIIDSVDWIEPVEIPTINLDAVDWSSPIETDSMTYTEWINSEIVKSFGIPQTMITVNTASQYSIQLEAYRFRIGSITA